MENQFSRSLFLLEKKCRKRSGDQSERFEQYISNRRAYWILWTLWTLLRIYGLY